jgi:hypothetical protein
MSALLTSLQETSLALWVSGSPSLLGYPTILVLHTIGLVLLVGPSVAISLRLLGVAKAAPLSAMSPFFRIMWIGLVINAVTGVLLFIADALHKAEQPVFWIKLTAIAGAVLVLLRTRRIVFGLSDGVTPSEGRGLAVAALLFWTIAMVAGRLMAYV